MRSILLSCLLCIQYSQAEAVNPIHYGYLYGNPYHYDKYRDKIYGSQRILHYGGGSEIQSIVCDVDNENFTHNCQPTNRGFQQSIFISLPQGGYSIAPIGSQFRIQNVVNGEESRFYQHELSYNSSFVQGHESGHIIFVRRPRTNSLRVTVLDIRSHPYRIRMSQTILIGTRFHSAASIAGIHVADQMLYLFYKNRVVDYFRLDNWTQLRHDGSNYLPLGYVFAWGQSNGRKRNFTISGDKIIVADIMGDGARYHCLNSSERRELEYPSMIFEEGQTPRHRHLPLLYSDHSQNYLVTLFNGSTYENAYNAGHIRFHRINSNCEMEEVGRHDLWSPHGSDNSVIFQKENSFYVMHVFGSRWQNRHYVFQINEEQ